MSGATKIMPSSARALRNSPFSVTLAWVQVSPDRYQTTGYFVSLRRGGTNTENVVAVRVSKLSCLYTPCIPRCDRASDGVSIAIFFEVLEVLGNMQGIVIVALQYAQLASLQAARFLRLQAAFDLATWVAIASINASENLHTAG